MEDRNKIVKFCEEYLQVKNFKDYSAVGLNPREFKIEKKKILERLKKI